MLKLPLKRPKIHPDFASHTIPWSSCAPFVENTRGVLVHRPKKVSTHTFFKKPHIVIEYMCGNSVAGSDKFTFLAAPPEDAIVCEICEKKAIEAGLPSSDELAGRHVHIGRLKAVASCGCKIPERFAVE